MELYRLIDFHEVTYRLSQSKTQDLSTCTTNDKHIPRVGTHRFKENKCIFSACIHCAPLFIFVIETHIYQYSKPLSTYKKLGMPLSKIRSAKREKTTVYMKVYKDSSPNNIGGEEKKHSENILRHTFHSSNSGLKKKKN